MKYLLDLTTLLIFLGGKKQSGEISAELRRIASGTRGPYHAHITLKEGNIVACTIRDREDRIFMSGESAQRELKQTIHNEWEWVPTPPLPIAPPLSARTQARIESLEQSRSTPKDITMLIPRRTLLTESIDKNVLPRRYWQILLLIDGKRTIAQLAHMLTFSPSPADLQKLIDILKHLQERRLIVVSTN